MTQHKHPTTSTTLSVAEAYSKTEGSAESALMLCAALPLRCLSRVSFSASDRLTFSTFGAVVVSFDVSIIMGRFWPFGYPVLSV